MLARKSDDNAWPVAILYERVIFSSTDSLLKHLRLGFNMGQGISKVNQIGTLLEFWPYFLLSFIINWCKQFPMSCSQWVSVITVNLLILNLLIIINYCYRLIFSCFTAKDKTVIQNHFASNLKVNAPGSISHKCKV